MSRTLVWVLVAVAVVLVAVAVVLVVRRRRYIGALRSRGWVFESAPVLASVLDHQAPPFGLGFERSVDEGVAGTTRDGVPFRVFEYAMSEGGPRFDERVASLRLPLALPDLFVSTSGPRPGVRHPAVPVDPALQVHAGDPGYARTLFNGPVLAALAAFGRAGHGVDVSVDGANLVAVGAPKDPDELEAYLELLAPAARAVDPAALTPYAVPTAPPGFTFYGRPDWLLVGSDDSAISRYGLTTAGFGHSTEKVVRGSNDGLPVEGLVHRWKTQRTEHYTDSEGRSQTRTVTDHHSEVLAAVTLPFAFPLLTLDAGWGGERVTFESEEFNDRFKVRTGDPRLAYDVIHPRTMEFLMAVRPPGFRIEGTVMRFLTSSHDTQTLGFCADFAHDFFARVPSFVWQNLRVQPPTFRPTAIEAASA